MTAKQAAELLDVIESRAAKLAAQGVRRVELGEGIAFTLEPAGEAPALSAGEPDEPMPDALHDPATFGDFGPDAPRSLPRRTRSPLVPTMEDDQ